MLFSPSLRQQLQHSTHAIHQALHRDPLLSRLTAPDCSLAEYQNVLGVFFCFYRNWETRFDHLARYAGEAPVLDWLREDFSALGHAQSPPFADDYESQISCRQASEGKCHSAYLGYLYVKQGSTLGGQVLSRQLQKNLGVSPSKGLRFFYGFGEKTTGNWRDVLDYLDKSQPTVDIPTAIASARAAFHTLKALLEKSRPATLEAILP